MKKFLHQHLWLIVTCFFVIIGTGFFLASTQDNQKSELFQERFDSYLDELFAEEIVESTLNLHYTLKHPENYGIGEYAITYGELNRENFEKDVEKLKEIRSFLKSYKKKQLRPDQQLTYDILWEEIKTEAAAEDFYLYQEILKPSTGIQAELPVLLAEYAFYREQDVKDYLVLLGQTKEYFRQILLFELEKANEGLFMAEFVAEDLIGQSKSFIKEKENNYLLATFEEKIAKMEGLSEEQKQVYVAKNKELVENTLIPAYEMLITGMEKLKTAGKNLQGLCYWPEGKEYYEYLVKSYTGSDWGVKQMQQATEKKREADMSGAAALLQEHPELLTMTTTYSLEQQDPVLILQELRKKMQEDFPASVDTGFTVKYVHESMESYMAPAFYLSVPIDDVSHNAIYINGAGNYQKIKLFTTLAHEGYPGHLYQNVMERSQEFAPIRNMLGSGGYSEGWATYVEMISYEYADMDQNLAALFQLDQSAMLSLYATADMGIHYDGWGLEEMITFFGEYQITDRESLQEVYQLIVAEPAHYLKYYVGYLEFLDLKNYAKELFQKEYSDYKFHEALMQIGPASFSVIKKYLPEYYDSDR